MEADWEFEIGGDAPVIEAYWSGFIDLRAHPRRISELSECRELPALADALLALNKTDSGVWTTKTDIFIPERIDLDEIAACADEGAHAISSYIDLLRREERAWVNLEIAERDCKQICTRLKMIDLSRCRVDFVVRRAIVAEVDALGATVYLTASGSTDADARSRLGECLDVFTGVMVSTNAHAADESLL
jgi:hypothetical protein